MGSPGLLFPPKLHHYIRSYGLRETPEQVRLREETAQMPNASWARGPETAALLQLLVRVSGARQVLEVGTFTGICTLALALAVPEGGGKVVTCDAAAGWGELGARFWRAARVEQRIERRIGRAGEVLDGLLREGERSKFDLVFLDADPLRYETYLVAARELLRKGGLLAVGGVLCEGRVAESSETEPEVAAVSAFNRGLHQDEGFDLCLLPIDGGLTVAVKQ